VTHVSDHPLYTRLNARPSVGCGEFHRLSEEDTELVIDVTELIWEPIEAWNARLRCPEGAWHLIFCRSDLCAVHARRLCQAAADASHVEHERELDTFPNLVGGEPSCRRSTVRSAVREVCVRSVEFESSV
jgi:hypothetical protein